MKKVLYLIIASILCVIPAISAPDDDSATASWQKVNENSYLDADGVIGLEDIYGFSFLMKSYNKGQYEPYNGKTISYTLGQYTIDCGKRKYKIGVLDSYGSKDNFINGDYNRYATFQPIVQGTAVSDVAKMLCR